MQSSVLADFSLNSGAQGTVWLSRRAKPTMPVSQSANAAFFETKEGPYDPATMVEYAPWAPAEGDSGALAYLEKLRGLFDFQLAD